MPRSRGVPIVSALIRFGMHEKLYHINDPIQQIVLKDDPYTEYSGKLVGIELGERMVVGDPGHAGDYMSFDNVSTDNYLPSICGLVTTVESTHEISRIVVELENKKCLIVPLSDVSYIQLLTEEEEFAEDLDTLITDYIKNDIPQNQNIQEFTIDPDNMEMNIVIGETTEDLPQVLIDMFASMVNVVESVTFNNSEGESATLIVGYQESYPEFYALLNKSLPDQNTQAMEGEFIMANETGTQLTYTLKVTYRNEEEMAAKIGDVFYPTLDMAIATAKSGDTIVLLNDIVCDNTKVASDSRFGVYTLPAGVNVDGANHVISADTEKWIGTEEAPANHIIAVNSGVSEIKNLILRGHTKMKSGICGYSKDTTLTLTNITAQNCGNVGIQISGCVANLTDIKTSGNAWGAINVDKASTGDIPKVVFNSGVLSEDVELYTEITDQEVITAPGYTKVQGFGKKLKGFIYYMSAEDKLAHVAVSEGKIFETVTDVMVSSGDENVDVTLLADVDEDVVVPVGAKASLVGATKETAIRGSIKLNAVGAGQTVIKLRGLVLDGQGVKGYGIFSQNQTDEGQMEAKLSMYGVTLKNYTAKGLYMTNAVHIHMTGCTVQDCATGETDNPNTKGDHAIDLNLVAVQNAFVSIVNNYFKGKLGKLSAIKVSQRGGESDKQAADMPHNVPEAKIKTMLVTGNALTESDVPQLLIIGETHKSSNVGKNTTAAFEGKVEVSASDPQVSIMSNVITENNTLIVPSGRTATKTAEADMFTLVKTPDEEIDQVFDNLEDIDFVDEGDNTFSITVADGTIADSGLFDQVAAIEGVKTITVTDGADKTATYTAGGDLEAFKAEVDAMVPKDNLSGTVTLTMKVELN